MEVLGIIMYTVRSEKGREVSLQQYQKTNETTLYDNLWRHGLRHRRERCFPLRVVL